MSKTLLVINDFTTQSWVSKLCSWFLTGISKYTYEHKILKQFEHDLRIRYMETFEEQDNYEHESFRWAIARIINLKIHYKGGIK